MAIQTEPLTPQFYWKSISHKTRLEPVAELVLVAVLLGLAGRGEVPVAAFSGPEAFRRIALRSCPWFESVRWRMPAPEERVDVRLPLELTEDPAALLEGFLDVFGRDFLRKSALRPELIDALTSWLEEKGAASTWIVGEERAFVAVLERARQGRPVRFATPSGALALGALALRAYGVEVEVEQLRPGLIDLRGLDGPVLTVPEPNVVTGRAPVGIFQQDEFNYANAALGNGHRIAAILAGGVLFRTQGEDLDVKRRFLKSGRLAAAIAFPPAAGVRSGIETLGVLLCGAADETSRPVSLVTFPKLVNTRHNWPDGMAGRLVRAVQGMPEPHFGVVPADAAVLLDERCILTAGSRLSGAEEKMIDDLLEARGSRSLSTFVEVIRCHTFGAAGEAADEAREAFIREATPNDINEGGILEAPGKRVLLRPGDRTQARRLSRQRLRPGDILFTQRGRIGAISLVEEIPEGECWAAGQLFLLLRMRGDSPVKSPAYVLRYLQSEPVRRQLVRLSSNTSVPQIRAEDLENLPVPLPDPRRGTTAAEASHERIRSLFRRMAELRGEMQAALGALDV